jgi:hypothetical protein
LFAWLLIRNGPPLQWDGDHSFTLDIIATAFLLPLIVALIVIPLQRGKLRKGSLSPISLDPESLLQKLVDRFPEGTGKSALLFGMMGLFVFSPATLAGFYLFGVEQLPPLYYATFKGIWAGLMAAIIVVPMVLVALRPAPVPVG